MKQHSLQTGVQCLADIVKNDHASREDRLWAANGLVQAFLKTDSDDESDPVGFHPGGVGAHVAETPDDAIEERKRGAWR